MATASSWPGSQSRMIFLGCGFRRYRIPRLFSTSLGPAGQRACELIRVIWHCAGVNVKRLTSVARQALDALRPRGSRVTLRLRSRSWIPANHRHALRGAPRHRWPAPRVTAAMVAARAGVSTATVSLVANGKTQGRVSEDNISRVREAIAELGYVVDSIGSSLAKGVSSIVILVAPDISNPFFAKVIAGVRESLGAEYQLLLSVTDAGEFPQRRRRPQADGAAAGRAAGGCAERGVPGGSFRRRAAGSAGCPRVGVLRAVGESRRRPRRPRAGRRTWRTPGTNKRRTWTA